MGKKLIKYLSRFVIFLIVLAIIGTPLLYITGKYVAHTYADRWAEKLIDLDNKNLLSTHFGAAWQDIVYGESMESIAKSDTGRSSITIIDGLPVEDYPAISVVEKLNSIDNYSNQIRIEDRHGEEIALIRTDHQRMPYDSFPKTLVESICAAEDKNFFENDHGFEYDSFVRAFVRALLESAKSGRLRSPRGTSTVTQQVGKMFVSQLDSKGQRYVSRSVDRKLREIRIAAALRKKYSAEEIMEVYLNYCLTSSYGLIGAADVSQGLWGKSVTELSDAESVYLARMVKWGVNHPSKIKKQCHIDMGRIQERLGWSDTYRDSVLVEIDSLSFQKPRQVDTEFGHLVDLANLYWLKFLEMENYSEQERSELDLLDPNSLIRKKGNCTIQLSIDLPLQRFLSEQVSERGFGDSTIITDIRVGSRADTVAGEIPQEEPGRWVPRVLTAAEQFSDPGSHYFTTVDSGDTVYTNLSYDTGDSLFPSGYYRRVERYYVRGSVVTKQYYSYGIMDAQSGELRAYTSLDQIGSHCASLFGRPVPNGSSTVKPILYTLLYDLGMFKPHDRWDDRVVPEDSTAPWFRTFQSKGKGGEYFFQNTGNGAPYRVKNHGYVLEGDQYIWEQLNRSNNILAVEAIYRLNGILFDRAGNLNPEHFAIGQLLLRLNLYDQMKSRFAGKMVTGVRIVKEIARIVGVSVDSVKTLNGAVSIPDDNYSVALGTMEMTLLEQMHLFNSLYDNTLIANPREHPSLFIRTITFGGRSYNLAERDTIVTIHPYGTLGDKETIRPTQLGLHKRLGQKRYDIAIPAESDSTLDSLKSVVHNGILSNFAKSGTTDDIRNPYYYDRLNKSSKTNYCLWNATMRVDMEKFKDSSTVVDTADLTIACIGEGSRLMNGGRDGKSMHKYLSNGLLKQAGFPVKNGFFSRYETFLNDAWINDSIAAAVDTVQDTVTIDTTTMDTINDIAVLADAMKHDSDSVIDTNRERIDTAVDTVREEW